MEKAKILEDIRSLIQDIDKCHSDIVNASVNRDFDAFEEAKCKESGLLAAAHQELSFLYDYIKEGGNNEGKL